MTTNKSEIKSTIVFSINTNLQIFIQPNGKNLHFGIWLILKTMKKVIMKLYHIIAIFFLILDTSVFAQTGQKGADYPPITNKHLAVIIIDFPDTPKSIKDNYFPSIAALRDTIFNGSIKKYLTDMSYGQFTLTGDVFGYFTHQNPGFVNGQITKMTDILTINTINIPGFDINKYDGFAIVPINDVVLESAMYSNNEFLINGNLVHKDFIYVPVRIGYWDRDPIKNPDLNNTLKGLNGYNIPISDGNSIDDGNDGTNGTTKINYSQFNSTFSHELGHFLGLGRHANSRTNGTSYDYEPEITNNNCLCYGIGSPLGSLLSREYGNYYDLMGMQQFGISLNMAFRDYFGWTNSTNRYSIKDYGHFTTTIYPINYLNGIRTVEIRIPFQYNETNKKNKGYFLEVKSGNYRWDRMLLHPQLQGNNDGIMVVKTDGFNSELLDMSPSPNISIYGIIDPDIRDVVIKPGMVYDNNEIRLSNIIKNADGSFKVDIDVLGTPTGIKEISNSNKFKVFPNPTTGSLKISAIESLKNDYKIELFNILGDILISKNVSKTNMLTLFDLTLFPKGFYILRITYTTETYQTQIIKI